MKKTNRRVGYLLAAAILLSCSIVPQMTAYAAGVSVSSKSVTVGSTVTITVKFSQSNIGAVGANFSYDASILQYTGGSGTSGGGGSGKIVLSAGAAGTSSLSASIKFKALKVGSATVSVSTYEFYDMDTNPVGKVSGSGKITVKEATVSTPKPSTSASAKPSPSASGTTASPTPLTSALPPVPVTVNGTPLYIVQDLSAVPLPGDFTLTEVPYQSGTIKAAVRSDGKLTLAYLADASGQNGAFYVMDTATSAFYPYIHLAAAGTYTVLQLPPSTSVPDGYQQANLTLDGKSVPSWQQSQGKNPEFYLLYAMSPKGDTGFYLYDSTEGSIQRYADRSVSLTSAAVQKTLGQTIKGNSALIVLIVVPIALCVLLAALLLLSGRKKRRLIQKEEDILPEDEDLPPALEKRSKNKH